MFAPSKIKVGARAVALALALATSSFSAHAVLERVGPVSAAPADGGFPSWYQDTTGLALEFCSPMNASEVNGGWCLLLPGDVPVAPEVFPTSFFDEHFYFAATAAVDTLAGGRTLVVLAEEAAFANGPVVAGDQVTFSRIRVWMTQVPVTGAYRFIHPYGEEIIQGVAGERIFFTDDVGLGCNGGFECSMTSRLGPFLLPAATPGGAEMPPLTATNPAPDTNPANFGGVFAPTPYPGTGKAYIADPTRIGPVTGSPLPDFVDSTGALRNHNIFRIEGPAGSGLGIDPATGAVVDWIETTDFNLMGRLFDGAMPGKATVNRASYTRNATGLKVDVLATGAAATLSRMPAQPAAPKIAPTLSFFDAPCAGSVDPVTLAIKPPYSAPLGATETQMLSTGESFWGQIRPATLPSSVCVKNGNARDLSGNVVAQYIPHVVTDEVTVSQAVYDQSTGILTVAASSSDELVPPVLNLSYGTFSGPLVGGQIAVPNVAVPPANVAVLSSALGSSDYMVKTGYPGAPAPGAPVTAADSYTFAEDSGAQVLAVLANDSNVLGGTVGLSSAPSFGNAVVNANGTVTYTPNVNANGADSFTYIVTVGTQISSPTTVSLNITAVNDLPVAVNDTASMIVNTPIQINVLANDTDPDGAADLANALIVTQPAAGATVTGGAGGIVAFNATAQGTYSFTYRAQDASGALSLNTGRVTVTVTAPFTVGINRNQYQVGNRSLLVEGVTNDPGTPTVTVKFTDNAGTVLGTGGSVVAAGGKWKLSATVALPAGATRLIATTPAGAVSPSQAITFK